MLFWRNYLSRMLHSLSNLRKRRVNCLILNDGDVITPMEMFTISLCIAIGLTFGDLQQVEIGNDDLKAREDKKVFRTTKVKEAVNLDQSLKSRDAPEIVYTMMSFAIPGKDFTIKTSRSIRGKRD